MRKQELACGVSVFVSVLVTDGLAQNSACYGPTRIADVEIALDGGGNSAVFTRAYAYAARLWVLSCPPNANYICSGGGGEANSCFCGLSTAGSMASVSQVCDDGTAAYQASADAKASSTEIKLTSEVTSGAMMCDPGCSTTGVVVGIAHGLVVFGSESSSSPSATGNVNFVMSDFSVSPNAQQRVINFADMQDPSNSSSYVWAGMIDAPEAAVGYNVALGSGGTLWQGSLTASTTPGGSIGSLLVSGADSSFDVDNDGRFAVSDSVALAGIVGTQDANDPAYVDRFDFNASGVIDLGDIEVVDAILDADLGSGAFGDADADADADCADYAAAVVDFVSGSVLGDADYEVTYDFDLDGDNDATDRDEIRRLLSPADMAAPFNVLDFTDVIAFNTAFAAMDPSADLAAPFGTFDFSDVIAFNTAFATGCPN